MRAWRRLSCEQGKAHGPDTTEPADGRSSGVIRRLAARLPGCCTGSITSSECLDIIFTQLRNIFITFGVYLYPQWFGPQPSTGLPRPALYSLRRNRLLMARTEETESRRRMIASTEHVTTQAMGGELRRPVVRRQARPGWVAINFTELWQYRELLVFQAVRDIKVRYKQTLLGAAWAILQPVLTTVVFSIFFGRLAGISAEGLPYPVFAFCALLPWQLFAYALTHSSNSLVDNAHVLTKVYFPRLIIPLAAVMASLVDFAIAFLVLAGIMVYYGIVPGWAVITLPLFILLAVTAALAVGLWLSALNVKYRDIRHTIPFLAQLWLLVTPVAYSSSLVPPQWRAIYGVNPMVSVVEGFRWALLSQSPPPGAMLAVSAAATAALLVGGLFYFRRLEKTFADVV
jgi:lipopolysaccharide transport system permease protein